MEPLYLILFSLEVRSRRVRSSLRTCEWWNADLYKPLNNRQCRWYFTLYKCTFEIKILLPIVDCVHDPWSISIVCSRVCQFVTRKYQNRISLDISNNENNLYCLTSNLEEKIKNCDQFSSDLHLSKTRYFCDFQSRFVTDRLGGLFERKWVALSQWLISYE